VKKTAELKLTIVLNTQYHNPSDILGKIEIKKHMNQKYAAKSYSTAIPWLSDYIGE
jgi:hypothetical protein